MLATIGWVFPKYFHFAGGVSTDPVAAFWESDTQWWAQFVLLCGVIEAQKFYAATNGKGYLGGDVEPFYDPAGIYPKDAEGRKVMQERELRNARLAMIGIASFAANHAVPGSVPFLPEGF